MSAAASFAKFSSWLTDHRTLLGAGAALGAAVFWGGKALGKVCVGITCTCWTSGSSLRVFLSLQHISDVETHQVMTQKEFEKVQVVTQKEFEKVRTEMENAILEQEVQALQRTLELAFRADFGRYRDFV